jgi:hypothetical protein
VIGRLLTTGAGKRSGSAVPEEVLAAMGQQEDGASNEREAEPTGPRP